MKKSLLSGIAALLLVGCAATVTRADDSPVQKPISVKLGAFLPTGSGAKDRGSAWFQGGLEYGFGKTDEASPSVKNVYLDYTQSKSKNGNPNSVLGIGVGVRSYGEKATNTKYAPYYGAGVGAYFQKGAKSTGANTSSTKTNLTAGLKGLVGVELNQGVFAEAGYTYLFSKANGQDLGGFNVALGLRF